MSARNQSEFPSTPIDRAAAQLLLDLLEKKDQLETEADEIQGKIEATRDQIIGLSKYFTDGSMPTAEQCRKALKK